ncbi:MAG: hypothetical protein B6245_01665 [Desulfobacteraceae bacterium 4572_88]|nr:MAG: hypothetical protein B6245_01665 [Desulfobacteraceae bacterium 4572_88]
MAQLKCEMKDICLERDHNFKLDVPELSIPEGNGLNKLPLMGKSGAGKSTLLNIMAGIEWPHDGLDEVQVRRI